MNLLSRLSVRYKILSIAAVVLLAFSGILIGNFIVNSKNTERLDKLSDTQFPVLDLAGKNVVLQEQMVELFQSSVASNEVDDLRVALDLKNTIVTNLNSVMELDSSLASQINQVQTDLDHYFNLANNLSAGMINDTIDYENLSTMIETMNMAKDTLHAELVDFEKQSHATFQDSLAQTNKAAKDALTFGVIISVITVLVILLISSLITKQITQTLNDIVVSLKGLAEGEGDLTKRVPQVSQDEIGDVVIWFNRLLDKLHKSVSDMVHSVQPLSGINSKLSESGTKAKEITDIQIESTQKLSEDLRDLVTQINHIQQNASNADDEAKSTSDAAQSGSEIVAETVDNIREFASQIGVASATVQRLKSDAQSAGDILQVIQSIAEQTNLLALNAAIEAARAGEQGRGFAVVADEVRTLASRTHASTEEIQTVLEKLRNSAESASEVMEKSESYSKESVASAERTGESLTLITEKVSKISSMNTNIADTVMQQQKMAQKISSNISDIDQLSELVAERMHDVTNDSSTLDEVSHLLSNISSQYKV